MATIGHVLTAGLILAATACGRIGYDALDDTDASLPVATCTALAPGSLDPEFGDKGHVRLDKIPVDPGRISIGFQSVEDASGRLLVASHSHLGFVIARLAPDGSVDEGYGVGGYAVADIGPGYDSAKDVTLDLEGRVLVAGSSGQGGDLATAIARFDREGALDSSFAVQGASIVQMFPGDEDEALTDVLVAPSGEIYAAGFSKTASVQTGFVRRYLPDGLPDPSFGTAGAVELFGVTGSRAEMVALVGTRLIVGGHSVGTNSDFTTWGLELDGAPDTNYGSAGVGTIDRAGAQHAFGGVVDPGGKVHIGGFCYEPTIGAPCLGRIDSSGVKDPGFGVDGVAVVNLGVDSGGGFAVGLDGEGRLLLAGDLVDGPERDALVLRFDSSGVLDNTFGTGGLVRWSNELAQTQDPTSESLKGIIFDQEGRIVVTGFSAGVDGAHDAVVTRLCP